MLHGQATLQVLVYNRGPNACHSSGPFWIDDLTEHSDDCSPNQCLTTTAQRLKEKNEKN